MTTNEAVIKRIEELCDLNGITLAKLSTDSGLSPSALYELTHGRTQYPKVITVKRICDGLGITLAEFFNVDYINDLEVEDD